VFEGNGKFGEYAGGYEDWERCRLAASGADAPVPARAPARIPRGEKPADPRRGLSYKEQRELDALPARIEALEAEQAELHRAMGGADFYRQSGEKIAAAVGRLNSLKDELETCYHRWESLEMTASGGK
jgi:ATP-binding cassette subfamily F protein uup